MHPRNTAARRVTMMRHTVWALCWCTSLLLVHTRAQDDARFGIQAIEELTVEPDYRAIRLRWRYRHNVEPAAFRVKLCEVTSWNAKYRCRDRHLMNDADKSVFSHDVLRKPERGRYEAVIYDLRMLTNYSVAVEPEFGDASLLGGKYAKIKLLPSEKKLITTKGFSARASRCLANSSDIEVTTGPYFGGKISVEDTLDSRCSIVGNRSSPQENYTLTIIHDVCGSKLVNNSRIETTVIVHENREIVTHNSRRFLVVCSFLPETFTIRASVNVPLGSRGPDQRVPPFPGDAPNPNDVFTYDHYKHSNIRDSRMLADQSRALSMAVHPQADGHVANHIAVTLFFVVAGIVGSAVTVFWLLGSFRKKSQTSAIGAVGVTLDKERLMTNAKLDQRDAVVPIYAAPVALVSIRPLDDGRPDCSEA